MINVPRVFAQDLLLVYIFMQIHLICNNYYEMYKVIQTQIVVLLHTLERVSIFQIVQYRLLVNAFH